jgi:hypothetical protein
MSIETQVTPTNPIITIPNAPKDPDEVDYTSPTFNWDTFDEGSSSTYTPGSFAGI